MKKILNYIWKKPIFNLILGWILFIEIIFSLILGVESMTWFIFAIIFMGANFIIAKIYFINNMLKNIDKKS